MHFSLKDLISAPACRTINRAVLLTATALLLGLPLTAAAAGAGGKITAMKAMLFESHTGQFSKDILPDPKAALEDAPPFSSALIVVELSYPPGTVIGADKVEVVVKRGKGKVAPNKISKYTETVSAANDKGRYYAAFLLNETTCDPVQITATLNGDQKSKLEKAIPFYCPND